ncbi:19963_t:CDS:2, partial [Entrophospora sp. SA101]
VENSKFHEAFNLLSRGDKVNEQHTVTEEDCALSALAITSGPACDSGKNNGG